MIKYTQNLDTIHEDMLVGFFAGWPNPPSKPAFMQILKGSFSVWLAVDDQKQQVAGFITAISDGCLSAYIPLLEVRHDYQNRGIGKELVLHMLDTLSNLYMVDLLCDEQLQSYYAGLGMIPATGMCLRNYTKQNATGVTSAKLEQ